MDLEQTYPRVSNREWGGYAGREVLEEDLVWGGAGREMGGGRRWG